MRAQSDQPVSVPDREEDAATPFSAPLLKIAVYSARCAGESSLLTHVDRDKAQSWVNFGDAVWVKYGLSVRLLVHPATKVLINA